jgi:hypothetical protein
MGRGRAGGREGRWRTLWIGGLAGRMVGYVVVRPLACPCRETEPLPEHNSRRCRRKRLQ